MAYHWLMKKVNAKNFTILDEYNLEFLENRINISDSSFYLKKTSIESPKVNLTNNFTVIVWLKLKSLRRWPSILSFEAEPASIDFGFHYKTSKLYACKRSKSETNCFTTEHSIKLNKWYHLSLVISNSYGCIYINGLNASFVKFQNSDPVKLQSSSLRIGKSFYADDEYIDAIYEDIKIADFSLTPAGILYDYLTTLVDYERYKLNTSLDENNDEDNYSKKNKFNFF